MWKASLLAVLLLITSCSLPWYTGREVVVEKPPENSKQSLLKAVSATNILVPISTLGIGLSVAAIVMNAGKIGAAGLLGSFVCLISTLAVQRYSWMIAPMGLVLGVLVLFNAYLKNKEAFRGLVLGFQSVKDSVINGERDKANEVMSQHLSPETKKKVKKIKEKENV